MRFSRVITSAIGRVTLVSNRRTRFVRMPWHQQHVIKRERRGEARLDGQERGRLSFQFHSIWPSNHLVIWSMDWPIEQSMADNQMTKFTVHAAAPWHFLNFFPLPHGH